MKNSNNEKFGKSKNKIPNNIILNAGKQAICHYYMECGKRATNISILNNNAIKVCKEHFDELIITSDKNFFSGLSPDQYRLKFLNDQSLINLLKDQVESSKSYDDKEFTDNVNTIYDTLHMIEKEPDSFLVSLTPGYVREFVTSFMILYCGTNNLEKSLEALDLVKSLTRYIVLLDKAYDTKNMEYKVQAELLFKDIMKKTKGHLNDSINHTMAILWTVAEYEIRIKQRMFKEGKTFEKKELCYHILQKSSDTIVYATVFDAYIENFTQGLLQLYHFNQVLLDIQDDLKDLEEDLKNHDLNIFLMASLKNIDISDIIENRANSKDIKINSFEMILSIITYFENCIDEISVSKEFYFMKKLSNNYIKTLRNSINIALK